MKLFWKSYAIFFIVISLGNASSFLSPDSQARLYYDMMMKFYPYYTILFALNILNLVLTLLGAAIVFFYAFNIKHSFAMWRWVFIVRLLSDLAGHHYEWKFIQGAFVSSTFAGIIGIASLTVSVIPSYIAHYRYAFKK